MDNKINIAELLKDAPKGTKLYSPVYGEAKFMGIEKTDDDRPIAIAAPTGRYRLYSDGRGYLYGSKTEEIILFPSKDCRTWENFKAPWKRKQFEPFQKVLVARTTNNHYIWRGAIYSHYDATHKCHILADGQVKSDNDILLFAGNENKLGKEVE